MPNPFKPILGFLKKIFGWVIKNTELDDFVKREFNVLVLAVVKTLSDVAIPNELKFQRAFDTIKSASKQAGYNLKDSMIRWLIETAVLKLKGHIGE